MITISDKLLNEIAPALVQGAIWGASGLAAHKFTQDKKSKQMTPEEKKSNRNKMLATGLAGGAAGALGTLASQYQDSK